MYQFAESLKTTKAFYFYTGTTALYALLKSMGVGQGDEVILPVFTCPAVPSPVVSLGAVPVYTDIDPDSFNIDPDEIEARITSKTKVIIAQHTFGIPAEMDRILDIARKHNLWVIEDSCHALGSKYRGREVSTFGDAAIYSFGWYKPIALGLGGAAIVNNPALKPKVEKAYDGFVTPPISDLFTLHLQYSVYALLYKPSRFWFMKEVYRRLRDFKSGPREGKIGPLIFGYAWNEKKQSVPESEPHSKTVQESPESSEGELLAEIAQSKRGKAGKRIIPLQDKRLFRRLEHWDKIVAHQRWVVSRYEELLSKVGYLPFRVNNHLEPVYYKYPLLFDRDRKKAILKKAQQARIEMSDMFGSPLYPAERAAGWKALGYEEGMCPISEDISDRIIALPIHARVQAKEIEKTVAFLASSL